MKDLITHKIDMMIIGAHKSGTSSLKEYLGQHPQIVAHPQLEMGYFIDDTLYRKGYEYAFRLFYREVVQKKPSARVFLAKNVGIMYSGEALKRLRDHNPDVQIIMLLRNPVDRAYSQFWYARRLGLETIEEFSEALEADPSRFGDDEFKKRSCDYLGRGKYCIFIQEIFKYFPPENTSIFLLEDVKADANQVCNLIVKTNPDLRYPFQFETSRKHNTSALPRFPLLAKVLSSPDSFRWIKGLTKSIITPSQINSIRNLLVNQIEYDFKPPPMPAEQRLALIEYYRPYNDELMQILQRDLSSWNNF
jgi:hypothetical protein